MVYRHSLVCRIAEPGKWYHFSWKGDQAKSGGIATNIGIHFFDMLIWIFGGVRDVQVEYSDYARIKGTLQLEKARVNWFLSLDRSDLPEQAVSAGKPTFRSITVDGEEIEFSGGFTDLHTQLYRDLLRGGGFGPREALPRIDLVQQIRQSKAESKKFHQWHAFVQKSR